MTTFAERIDAESRGWVRDGLITDVQAEAIRTRYAHGAGAARRGRLITVLATIGAVAVGIGVILFFAANWDAIPKLARLALLLVAVAGSLAGGETLRARYRRVGEAVTFLGGLLFGAAIFLVGQMYNISDDPKGGFILWAAGAAAGTAIFRTPPWAALTLATFGTWLGILVGAHSEYGEMVPFALALYGLAIYAAATRLRRSELLGLPRGLGLALATIPIFVLTCGDVADEVAHHEHLPARIGAAIVACAVAAVAAAAWLAFDRTRRHGRIEAAAIAVTAVALLLGTRVPLPAVAFNLLFVALALGAIWIGFENDEVWLVNVGIALVAAEMIARFFDVFWRLLPRSAAFIAAGALILAVAWVLERQRSRLVARMAR